MLGREGKEQSLVARKLERGQNSKIDDRLFLLSLQIALDQNAEKALHTRTKKRVLRTSDLPVHRSWRVLGSGNTGVEHGRHKRFYFF